MAGYTILKMENISDVLKKKPRLTTCIAFALAMFVVTVSAIGIGVFIGYTYCYIEHHSGFRTSNLSNLTKYHVLEVTNESEEVKGNRTINGALSSSVLVTRLLNIGQTLLEDELKCLSWHGEDSHQVLK